MNALTREQRDEIRSRAKDPDTIRLLDELDRRDVALAGFCTRAHDLAAHIAAVIPTAPAVTVVPRHSGGSA